MGYVFRLLRSQPHLLEIKWRNRTVSVVDTPNTQQQQEGGRRRDSSRTRLGSGRDNLCRDASNDLRASLRRRYCKTSARTAFCVTRGIHCSGKRGLDDDIITAVSPVLHFHKSNYFLCSSLDLRMPRYSTCVHNNTSLRARCDLHLGATCEPR
jgi:hypothetical protein